MNKNYEKIVSLVCDTLVEAGSTFREDKKKAYKRVIASEDNERAKWVLETVLMGDDSHRIDQSGGLNPDSAGVEPAPILIRRCQDNVIRLHILMFGGGPAIRAKTYRVFHKHNTQVVLDEIVNWATEGVTQLGCSPCTLAVGVGRSHFEATSMMLQAQVDGRYDFQSEMEQEITRRVNEANIGPLGLHGKTSVIATFMKVGPQRASGVRIVCVRPTCCFEPRIASVELE